MIPGMSTQTIKIPAVENARAVLKRRELLNAHLTPEVLDELDKLFGTDDMIYAFPLANPDPLVAMRRDTLMGMMRSLRHEASESSLAAARENLAFVEQEVNHA